MGVHIYTDMYVYLSMNVDTFLNIDIYDDESDNLSVILYTMFPDLCKYWQNIIILIRSKPHRCFPGQISEWQFQH
jgi:hypothetical protein